VWSCEWLVEKHGTPTRRSWRKLHLGVDADTGQIVASELTTKDVDDSSQVGLLLDQVERPVASFTGDGAFDQEEVYRQIALRHPAAEIIVPPRSNAVPSETAETAPPLLFQPLRGRNLEQLRQRSATGICSSLPSAVA
jgi:Transposase DDE domain